MGDGFSKDFTVQGETAQALTAPGRRATPGVTAIESTSSAHISPDALYSLSFLKPTFLLPLCVESCRLHLADVAHVL